MAQKLAILACFGLCLVTKRPRLPVPSYARSLIEYAHRPLGLGERFRLLLAFSGGQFGEREMRLLRSGLVWGCSSFPHALGFPTNGGGEGKKQTRKADWG